MYKRNSFNHHLLAAKVETCFLFCLVIAMSKPIPSFPPSGRSFQQSSGPLLRSTPSSSSRRLPIIHQGPPLFLPTNMIDFFLPSLSSLREAASRVRRHKKGGMKKEGSVFPALSLSPLGQPLVLSGDPLYVAFYTEIAKKT